MVTHTPDAYLVIAILSLWFVFPIGMFLSVSHVDKNTDQIIHLQNLRHESVNEMEPQDVKVISKAPLIENFKIAGTTPKWARH